MIIKTDKDTIESYLSDASNLKGSSEKVIIPETKEELKSAIQELFNNNINYVISGAGTGLTGGKVPKNDVVISLEMLNKVLEINEKDKYVVVQPAVTLNQLEEILSPYNLFLPPNPTEKNSSLGGNVANNSSGSRTFKYGAIRNYVAGLELILTNGDSIVLSRGENFAKDSVLTYLTEKKNKITVPLTFINFPETKHSGGYFMMPEMDAIDLFIGSEGTLAIISEIKLLVKDLPNKVLGIISFFDDDSKLLDFTDRIRLLSKENNEIDIAQNNDIAARLIEYFDRNSLKLLSSKYTQIPKEAIGAIWIEQEYIETMESDILEKWYSIISEYSELTNDIWVATNEKEHNHFREFRHELPMKVNEIISRNNIAKAGTDTAVPINKFRDYFAFIQKELSEIDLEYVIYGHIGDCHLHINMFPRNIQELTEAHNFYDKIVDLALEYGGTVSAEHGIGKLKKKYLTRMFGESVVQSMKNIKKIFDPRNLLARGNLFD